jgi:hypothetical protein
VEYDPTIRTAAQLTAEARAQLEVATPQNFTLSDYLPDRNNASLDYNFNLNQLNLSEAASFRAWDVEADFGDTVGSQSVSGKLPPISRKMRVGEYDTLVQQIGGSDILGGTLDGYAGRLGNQIGARVELARGQALETGSVVINEGKLKFTISFQRNSSHTVTAATVWSTITADVIGDLTTWRAVYVADNGSAPTTALISTAIMTALQKNTGIISAALGRGTDLPSLISQDAVRSVFAAYGFGNIVVNDEQVTFGGAATRVINSNKFVWLGSALGGTDWGVTAESINSKYGIAPAERPGVFAAAFDDNDPEGKYVLASAVVLPVLENANATFVGAVL